MVTKRPFCHVYAGLCRQSLCCWEGKLWPTFAAFIVVSLQSFGKNSQNRTLVLVAVAVGRVRSFHPQGRSFSFWSYTEHVRCPPCSHVLNLTPSRSTSSKNRVRKPVSPLSHLSSSPPLSHFRPKSLFVQGLPTVGYEACILLN